MAVGLMNKNKIIRIKHKYVWQTQEDKLTEIYEEVQNK